MPKRRRDLPVGTAVRRSNVQGKGFHMAAYRHHDDDSDNGNTNVTQRGKGNRNSNRSNNRSTKITILNLGRR